MSEKVLLKDIAKELGLSATTVSFILNGKGPEMKISSASIDRVFKYVNERGYKTNHLAKCLATGKTKIIGLLVEKISDNFFAELAYYVEKYAAEYGYKIMYCSTDNDDKTARGIINMFRERHVDAYIIVPTPGIKKEIKSLINDNIPVVLFDRYYPDVECSHVVLNNFESTYNATCHLIHECNRSQIAFITINSQQTQMAARLAGYHKAIEENHLTPYVMEANFSSSQMQTEKDIFKFLKPKKSLDALFFATNYLAMGGLKATAQLNLKVPDDVAFLSYDDQSFYSALSPSITGIKQPLEEMSASLISILIDQINHNERIIGVKKSVLPAILNVRVSSGALVSV